MTDSSVAGGDLSTHCFGGTELSWITTSSSTVSIPFSREIMTLFFIVCAQCRARPGHRLFRLQVKGISFFSYFHPYPRLGWRRQRRNIINPGSRHNSLKGKCLEVILIWLISCLIQAPGRGPWLRIWRSWFLIPAASHLMANHPGAHRRSWSDKPPNFISYYRQSPNFVVTKLLTHHPLGFNPEKSQVE